MPAVLEGDGSTVIEPPVRDAAERLAAGDCEGALAILVPAVEGAPGSHAARFLLAMTAWTMGRLDWALDLLRQCHDEAPMDGTVAETLASLYGQCGNLIDCIYMGKLATALGGHGALEELVPKSFPSFEMAFLTIKEQPTLARAMKHLAAGRLDEAIEQARQHVALDGGSAEGRVLLAESFLRAGRVGDAVEHMAAIEKEAVTSAPLASLFGRVLAAAGERDTARLWHEVAHSLAPEDAAIAAARIADGPWLYDAPALADMGADWTRRFAPTAKPRGPRARGERLVIAYIVSAVADPRDAAAIASVARAHGRGRCKILGYGSGAQSHDENTPFRGAFDGWQDVSALDGATIARYFRHDGVDVVVDASGFASPETLRALTLSGGVLRLSWLGNAAGTAAPIYDVAFGAALFPVPESRPQAMAHVGRQFGADLSLAALDDETLDAWRAILTALPEAKLVLRGTDTSRGTIDRLVARFGAALAARIELVAPERFEDFCGRIDVALAPRRGLTPRLAAEAASCGIPTIAFVGTSAIEPFAAFLAAAGQSDNVASDAPSYARRAVALATAACPMAPRSGDAATLARAIEGQAQRAGAAA